MADKTKSIRAAQLVKEGKSLREAGEILGVSHVQAGRLAKEGAPLLESAATPIPESSSVDLDVSARFKLARAVKMEAEARSATLKADEAQGRTVARDTIDEVFAELSRTIETISSRMKKESPASVEILREGLEPFDLYVAQRLGAKS